MHIRCPHCHSPIEVVDADPLTDISCPSCGSNFSLISGETAPHATEVASPTEVDSPSPPQRIGRYKIERLLGQGGFGLVYLAHDDQLARPVAIKVPHARLIVCPTDAEAYLTEARTVANLDQSLATVAANGGVCVVPRMTVPGVGWMAYCKDLDGHILGMMQPDATAA